MSALVLARSQNRSQDQPSIGCCARLREIKTGISDVPQGCHLSRHISILVYDLKVGARLRFWATVCKTVRVMLSDRCLSCRVLSVCLSVTLVYCGQTVGRIKMKLGKQVGLGPGHIVLDGDPAPLLQRGQSPPNFWPISVAVKRLQGSRCHLVWR